MAAILKAKASLVEADKSPLFLTIRQSGNNRPAVWAKFVKDVNLVDMELPSLIKRVETLTGLPWPSITMLAGLEDNMDSACLVAHHAIMIANSCVSKGQRPKKRAIEAEEVCLLFMFDVFSIYTC